MNTDHASYEQWGEGSYTPYVKKLTQRARDLRKYATLAETRLWNALRNKKFQGLKFVRQKPLLTYIVDFYCAKLRLVIEIDGPSHAETKDYDDLRTQELHVFDIRVIRYTDEQIEYDLQNTLRHLSNEIQKITST